MHAYADVWVSLVRKPMALKSWSEKTFFSLLYMVVYRIQGENRRGLIPEKRALTRFKHSSGECWGIVVGGLAQNETSHAVFRNDTRQT